LDVDSPAGLALVAWALLLLLGGILIVIWPR